MDIIVSIFFVLFLCCCKLLCHGRYIRSVVSVLFYLFGFLCCFGQMEPIDVVGVLQEERDADSRAHTISQMEVENTIIPYTSMSIRLPHLCQGYYDYCLVNTYDGGRWER